MWHAAWRSVVGHKSRFLLSLIAVSLGIAFMVGTFTFTGMIQQSFEGLTKGTIPDVDVSPAGSYDLETPRVPDPDQKPLSDDDLAKIRAVDGVEAASGVVTRMGVYPLNTEGRVTVRGQAPSMAFSWLTDPAFGHQPGIVLHDGRAPASKTEVAIDPSTLESTGHGLGDSIQIATQTGVITRTVVGTATWGSGGTVGAQYTFFTIADAQDLFLDGQAGYEMGWITLRPDADRAQVVSDINQILPTGWQATDGQEVADMMATFIELGLSFINTFLLVFIAIGLVVAIFLIVNTFSILVAQRSRELALYRALGASRGQVGRTVLFEAFVVGLVGSLIGLVAGVGLASGISVLLGRVGIDLSGTRPLPGLNVIAAALVVGVGVTILSAWLPSRQAARIPPVAAMSGQFERHEVRFGVLEAIAAILTVGGAAALLAGVFVLIEYRAEVVGLGALGMLLGVAGLAPVIGRPVTWTLGRLFRGVFGIQGKLADLNTAREPRRTAATASALMIGLTLVSALTVLGMSASASVNSTVRDSLRNDFEITTVSFSGLPAGLDEQLAKVAGVDQVVAQVNAFTMTAGGDRIFLRAYDPQHFNGSVAQELAAGEIFGTEIGQVIVSQSFADEHDLSAGDTLAVVNPVTGEPFDLQITGVFTTPQGVFNGSVNTNRQTAKAFGSDGSLASLGVRAEAGFDTEQLRAGLNDAIADYPMLSVVDKQEYADQQTGMIDSMINTIYALLALAIIIAVLGIINTLVLSTIERTRELGLLRAVGLQRGQLRTMITLESVAIAVLGAALGIGLGTAFGAALQRVLADSGLEILVLPWGRFALFLALSVLVGVLAALWPANRAAKLKILDAIAHE